VNETRGVRCFPPFAAKPRQAYGYLAATSHRADSYNAPMTSPPASAEDLFHRSTRLLQEGDRAGAEAALREALRLRPDLAEAHANLGWLLERDRPEEAETHYRHAIALQPWQIPIRLNFGAMLARRKRFAEAESAYRRALAIDPDAPDAWSNLGVLLASTKRERDAEQCYRAALAAEPDHRKARFNLAYLLLRQGRFEEGWDCLEAREPAVRLAHHLAFPQWQGEPLDGKSVLIGFEGGYGDMIQFCRYAELLKQAGAARVSVLCHPGLRGLFTTLRGADDAFAFDAALPDLGWDYWTLPLSLPLRFGTQRDSMPARLPYLSADPQRVRRWAEIIGERDGFLRVGLVWKGNARHENDADRSLPSLAALAPLAAVPGVRCFSLQKGAGEEEAAAPNPPLPLIDLGAQLGDFADTAAALMQLDLLVTVDTAAAHLAGALGRPCWVLLPDYQPDWRWLTDTDTSPWYPQVMRLFRQKAAGDWDATIAEVAAALHAFVRPQGR